MKIVHLSQLGKKHRGRVALVSDEDFERVSQFKWSYHQGSSKGDRAYAVRNSRSGGKRVWVRMHRFIMDIPPGTVDPLHVVDHVDGNGLNNQRENLEVVTFSENIRRAYEKRRALSAPYL